MASGDLVMNLIARTDRWNRGLNSAQRGLSGFVSSAMSGLAKIGLAMDGLRRVAGLLAEPIELARNQIMAEKRLEQVIRSTGGAAGFAADELKKFAAQRQELTNFGDEQTIQAAAVLGTFTSIQGDMFKQALIAAQDMSTLLEKDLQSQILLVGKALNDPIAGLSSMTRSGVQFTETQKEMIRNFVEQGNLAKAQGVILTELQKQFGGQAEALADPLTQAKNIWGDMKEEIGKIAMEFGPDLLNTVKELNAHMPEISQSFRDIAKFLESSVRNIMDELGALLQLVRQAEAAANRIRGANQESFLSEVLRDVGANVVGETGGIATGKIVTGRPGAGDIFGSLASQAFGAIRQEAINRGLTPERFAESAFVGPQIDPAILAHRGDAIEQSMDDRKIGGLEAGSQHAAEVLRSMVGPQEKKQDMALKESQKQTKHLEKIAKSLEKADSGNFIIGEID